MSRRRLWWALGINLTFLIIEVIGGILTNSLALLADAGHMLTDVAALGLALFVAHLARRPPTPDRTFGLLRAEVLGAFVNGATLMLMVGLIFREAWHRFGHPEQVDAPLMLAVAVSGLAANAVSAWILAGSRQQNVNIKGAFLHMVGDALGSVGAIIAGVLIWIRPGWMVVDPIASLVIGVIIMYGAVRLLKETMNILLQATPRDIDYLEVKKALEGMSHIDQVHDLHIWTLTSGVPILTGHIRLSDTCCDDQHWSECLAEARRLLSERFAISHSTLQMEPSDASCRQECEGTEANCD